MNKPKLVLSSTTAATVVIICVVVITIWAEFSPVLKEWLTDFSGHHWTSKSILTVLLYAFVTTALYFVPQKSDYSHLHRALVALLTITVLGVVVLTLFFTGHHFGLF